VPVYRRFTGGGTVYHDPGNLNVTVIVRRDDPRVAGRLGLLPRLYRLVLDPLADAARSLGAAAVATERDLLVGDSKIGGVAAWIGADSLLVHGTLLVDADLVTLDRVLDGPGAPGDPRWERTRSRRTRVTSLARVAAATGSRPPDPGAVDAAVVASFTGRSAPPGAITPDEDALAARLFDQRYRRPAWHELGTS
jgi:lipoate-protein ligase A